MAFSSDGKVLAAAYRDGTIRQWNPATDQAMGSLFQTGPGGSRESANGVAFSPDGTLLVGAYANGTVRLVEPGHRPERRRGQRRLAGDGGIGNRNRPSRRWPRR